MNSFAELNLIPELQKSLNDMGFSKPSEIQSLALPVLLAGEKSFIGLAATGTGKTAAFGLPLLSQLDLDRSGVQGLILCPTRELAMQVCEQLKKMGHYLGAQVTAIYGGSSYRDQFAELKRGTHIVVGTPGRLVDLIDRKVLKLSEVTHVILDEADEMISMGFKDDLETILGSTNPETTKRWLFSATMSREVRRVADQYLTQPKVIEVNRTDVLPESLEQKFFVTREGNKPEILCKLIDIEEDFYGIVFCQTKALVMDIQQFLHNQGYKVDCLHGDKDQKSRERTLAAFKRRDVNILICTDVAARGIDVADITHVINYSIPRELDLYVHRIGRTARGGKSGIAYILVAPSQLGLLRRLENITKSRITEGSVPSRKYVGQKKISRFLPKFQTQEMASRAAELMDDQWKEALKELSPEEVASRFLAMMFPQLFNAAPEKPLVKEAALKGSGTRGDRDRRDFSDRRDFRRDRPRGSGDRRVSRSRDQAVSEERTREERPRRFQDDSRSEGRHPFGFKKSFKPQSRTRDESSSSRPRSESRGGRPRRGEFWSADQ